MTTETTSATKQDIAVNMILSAWKTQNKRLDDLLGKLSDEQFLKETAPGRNRGIYLIGHLAAVNDSMISILGFGEKLYPELEETFLKNPDDTNANMPSVAQLKEYWKTINEKLAAHMDQMQAADWFSKHALVSAEDFAKEPHRNKLNILVNRANHQSYHLGQLAYLGEKKPD